MQKNHDYTSKLSRSLKTIDDAYIDNHFGTESAQYERVSAYELLKGGNISLKSVKVRNVQSDLRPGKHLLAFVFQCLSAERSVVHNLYIVFENGADGEYVPSPCSYCGCENGAFFCSHMLCFLYVASIIQRSNMTQEEIEKAMPEDRRLSQNIPCLLENLIFAHRLHRQKAQRARQRKRKAEVNLESKE